MLLLALGGIAGGFINGFAGTGTALFALGFFLSVLGPVHAVAVVALISVLSGFLGLWVVRAHIVENSRSVAHFTVPGLVGVPIGFALLSTVNADVLRLMVAALLITYGAYFGFRSALPRLATKTPITDATVGFSGGVLGGLASLSGALPTIWLSMRDWPKTQTRAVLQTYNVVILSATVGFLALAGAYDRPTLIALAIALPAGLAAAQVGIYVFKRLSDGQFRRVLILLCLTMGIGIVINTLSG